MTADSLEVRTYRNLEALQAIRGDWEDLLANYPLATTFSSPEWLMSWWRSFGKEQELLAVGFFSDSRLVALALLSIEQLRLAKTFSLRRLQLMGDGSKDSDNLDFPVRAGFEDKFAESLLRFLESEGHSWDFAELNTLPEHSPGARALRQTLGRINWLVTEKQRPASAVPLPAAWEEYLGSLSSEDQKNLARYTRRLEKRYAVQIYRCSAESQLPKSLEALFEHHQARWEAAGEPGSFGSRERIEFYYDLSRSLLPQQRLDLWVLELDGTVVAAQFGFRYGRQVFQLQEGNAPKHSSDRVGFVLRGHVMKQLIADGMQTYDFLAGELGYKARWGAQARRYRDIHFARPRSLGSAYLQAVHGAAQSKAWLRKTLPQRAWDLLHKLHLHFRPEIDQ
jgi:CelD/BcsL family acetyltransferase involved in cellulose biosynthesis